MEALKMEDRVDSWNDDRLDELSRRMDEGFKQINSEMKEGFKKIEDRFEKSDARFEKVATRESVVKVDAQLGRFEERLDRLYWAFIALAVLLIANGIIGNA
jgi:hypothetical protein